MKMANKRGDVSVTVLVFLTIVLCGAVLFMMATHGKTYRPIVNDARFIENVYSEEERINFHMIELEVDAYDKTYYDIAKEGLFTGNVDFANKRIALDSFDKEGLKSIFEEKFRSNFKNEVVRYTSSQFLNDEIKNDIANDKFTVTYEEGTLTRDMDTVIRGSVTVTKGERVWLWGVVPTFEKEEKIKSTIAVIYKPEISFIRKTELTYFGDILGAVRACKTSSAIKDCLTLRLNIFDINVKSGKDEATGELFDLVTLSTKKKFFIDGALKNIDMCMKLDSAREYMGYCSAESGEKAVSGESVPAIVASASETISMNLGEAVELDVNGEKHSLTLIDVLEKSAGIKISSSPIIAYLKFGESIKVDVNEDGVYDLELNLVSADAESGTALIQKEIISEKKQGIGYDASKLTYLFERGAKFPSSAISYSFDEDCSSGSQAAEKKEAALSAFANIESVTCLNFEEVANDPQITIHCRSMHEGGIRYYVDRIGQSVLGYIGGLAQSSYERENNIIKKSETYLYDTLKADEQNALPSLNTCSLGETALHEILHALGFGHIEIDSSIMVSSSSGDSCGSGGWSAIDQPIVDELNGIYACSL